MLKKIMERGVSEYAPQVNEATFSHDIPPPAYPKAMPTKLKLTKIISTTVVVLVAIVGTFILAGIYIRSKHHTCDCDNMPAGSRRLDQANFEPLVAMPSEPKSIKEAPLPLQLEINKDVEKLVNKNKKAHVNCIVEKKKATQVIANQPKTLMTPYGNITSDPGFIQMVGEKMIISCQTGMKKNPLKVKGDTGIRRRRGVETENNLCDCSCAC